MYIFFIPKVHFSIERNTKNVPNDGRFHVVKEGKTTQSFQSKKLAEEKFKKLLAEIGYNPEPQGLPSYQLDESMERYVLAKNIVGVVKSRITKIDVNALGKHLREFNRVENLFPEAMFIFGSFAKSTNMPDSDIDVAYVGNKKELPEGILLTVERFQGYPLDIISISSVEKLKKEYKTPVIEIPMYDDMEDVAEISA